MLSAYQITEELPHLMKTQTNKQIADHFGVSKYQISYWIKELKKKGYQLPERAIKGRPPRIPKL